MEADQRISLKDRDKLAEEEKGRYQRLVLTRPDLTYAVNVVNQFIHAPNNVRLAAAERILCYLKKKSR